jgi:hypothetical protein
MFGFEQVAQQRGFAGAEEAAEDRDRDWSEQNKNLPCADKTIGARLAGNSVRKIAFAGKPGSYRGCVNLMSV